MLSSENINFVNEMYTRYLNDTGSVSSDWQDFFKSIYNKEDATNVIHDIKGPSWTSRGLSIIDDIQINANIDKRNQVSKKESDFNLDTDNITEDLLRLRILRLMDSYRRYGHLIAKIDPLNISERASHPALSLEYHHIVTHDLLHNITDPYTMEMIPVVNMCDKLRFMYAGNIGAEFEHLPQEEIDWIEKRYHDLMFCNIDRNVRMSILSALLKAESFEQFIHTKFSGAKRFSIEGGESFLVLINSIIHSSSKFGVNDISIGMAHRGRLNTLTHICNKPCHQIFYEFMGNTLLPDGVPGSADVKYHNGYRNSIELESGSKVDITLMANPSHLEAINSVLMGRVRAKQDKLTEMERYKSLGILVHGDAAISGQGSVVEAFNMMALRGYTINGVIHVVINNQIGFTTNPDCSRSSKYCTDIAKTIGVPVFHVNGDDPESCHRLGILASEYRVKFKKDIVLDIVCYRKYGHNEGDEPMYTQPKMYEIIKTKKSVSKLYGERLISHGLLGSDRYNEEIQNIKLHLEDEYFLAQSYTPKKADWLLGLWSNIDPNISALNNVKTSISRDNFLKIGRSIFSSMDHININPKIKRLLDGRLESINQDSDLEWAIGELMAYGSILKDGFSVRLSGQDVGRGTFSHRHAILTDTINDTKYNILGNIDIKQGQCEIHNSLLSEFAALGFEYGYSITNPNALIVWEAQFGDFANGGTVIFDQFISSAESKWLRLSGLVMLLPHGFEGQGPEHSSARLERYLQACANGNIIVANCTTPANFFHILRRQIYSKTRKPLIIVTPKSLLRHKLAVSKIKDFIDDTAFNPVIDEIDSMDYKNISRIIITSGKLYYELYQKRNELGLKNTTIIRIEEYYPFPESHLVNIISKYKVATEIIWAQEEPLNMGAWSFISEKLNNTVFKSLLKNNMKLDISESLTTRSGIISYRPIGSYIKYVGRTDGASPAVGSHKRHEIEQNELINIALT